MLAFVLNPTDVKGGRGSNSGSAGDNRWKGSGKLKEMFSYEMAIIILEL